MNLSKTSQVLGGNGALGKAMVNCFAQSGWKVLSVDHNSNTEATANVIVDRNVSMKDQVSAILNQTTKFSQSFDAILVVSGGFAMGSVKDKDIFEQWERQDKINFQSALLGGHLATQLLGEQGLLMFTGAASVFEGPVNYAYAYAISKSATHALALQMAERSEIPVSSTVVTILPKIIDTPMNRKDMPDADHSTWAPPEKIAQMVRGWAQGENRPSNGSFARIEYENGTVFPKFM